MLLAPVFILETHNQTNNKCLPKFVQTRNPSSSIKKAIAIGFKYVRARKKSDNTKISNKNALKKQG